jgi:hypothetical protein
MDSDMKWFMMLIASFVIIPFIGLGIDEWHKKECRMELSKAGKTVEEIKELCK